jgi:hypothetical protein
MKKNALPSASKLSMIFAPPGSGYATSEDETSELPDSYEPMMEYPGTMRPGRTPENAPFHDLPMGDTDPDLIPWPHFQQIEWYHRWDPPHPHPIPMEEFIEQQGRWATPEMEAEMRAGVRRDVRQRKEMEEEQKRETLIMDDDDDDESDEPQDLGDGVFGQLGSDADMAITAAATTSTGAAPGTETGETVEATDEEDAAGFDDFLLDLGLDFDEDDDSKAEVEEEAPRTPRPPPAKVPLEDVEIVDADDDDDSDDNAPEVTVGGADGGDVTSSIEVDDDDELDLGLDEEDDMTDGGVSTVPLEDFDSDSDGADSESFFNDGGFDYDDGDFDSDGGDTW